MPTPKFGPAATAVVVGDGGGPVCFPLTSNKRGDRILLLLLIAQLSSTSITLLGTQQEENKKDFATENTDTLNYSKTYSSFILKIFATTLNSKIATKYYIRVNYRPSFLLFLTESQQ